MEPPDKLAAEMPKRRPSFRRHLSRGSRNSRTSASGSNDREQLLTETFQETDGGKPTDCKITGSIGGELTLLPPVCYGTLGYVWLSRKNKGKNEENL